MEDEYQEAILLLMRDKRTDSLTGLGNYFAFQEYVRNLEALGVGFSVVLFDMTNLKAANEELGHFGADAVLHQVGQRIRCGYDHVFRHGGDEFAVVLPRCALGGAQAVRDRIEKAVGVSRLKSGKPVAAVGACIQVTPDVSLTAQLNRCDKNLELRKAELKRQLG